MFSEEDGNDPAPREKLVTKEGRIQRTSGGWRGDSDRNKNASFIIKSREAEIAGKVQICW